MELILLAGIILNFVGSVKLLVSAVHGYRRGA
jgi:hypothetical protein